MTRRDADESIMAATAASPALKRLDLRDPAALFETHGAEEIRGLERQVRAEIEHKKEELRQMVGERYRDLIEAADTIGQMRRCAEGLVDAVKATDQYCARLRLAGSAAPRPARDPQVSPARQPRTPRSHPPRDPPPALPRPPVSPRPPARASPASGKILRLISGLPSSRDNAGAPFAGCLPVVLQLSSGAFPDFRALIPSPVSWLRWPLPTLDENARGLSLDSSAHSRYNVS